MSAASRQHDSEMSKHLAPAPRSWRAKPETFPYHNNLGAKHNHKRLNGGNEPCEGLWHKKAKKQ